MLAGDIREVLGEYVKQLQDCLESLHGDYRCLKISLACFPEPFTVGCTIEHFRNQQKIAFGWFTTENLTAHHGGDVVTTVKNRHRYYGQSRITMNLLLAESHGRPVANSILGLLALATPARQAPH